jgi:hypothetical protein
MDMEVYYAHLTLHSLKLSEVIRKYSIATR